MKEPKRKYKPSLWWLALAPLIIIVGVGSGVMLLLEPLMYPGEEVTFRVPINRTFDIEQTGTYVLSHNYKVVFQGRPYDGPASLPDEVVISLKSTNGVVEMAESLGSGSASENHERKEVGRFKVETPGPYTLSVSGLAEPRVMTLGESALARIVTSAIAGLLLNLIGWFVGPALVITVLSKRLKNKRAFRAQHPELFEDDDEEPVLEG